MIIKQIDVIPFKIVNKRRIVWAAGALPAAQHLVVKITGEDGTFGVAEAIPRPMIYGETQEGMYYALTKYLAPKLIGEDSFNFERIWNSLEAMPWNLAAKGALDVALHDLNARQLGVPVCKMLGGPYRNKVPLSWMICFGSNEAMLRELKAKLVEGYKAFKVKGGPDPDNDIKLMKLMRDVCPEGVRLYIDANMAYGQNDAIRVLKALEGVLDCAEEPTVSWDDRGRKGLAGRITTPILSDESTFTVPEVFRQIQLGAIREVGIKIPRTGFTLSRKIVHLAEMANIPVQVSTQAECDFGTAAGLQFACAFRQVSLPCELTYFVDDAGDSLLTTPLVIEDGCLLLPDRPGMGVELDWEKVEKYRISI